MTPAARIAAAIEVLDAWLGGEPAEKALTRWARGHRFAGSGDRDAIRNHVYEAIRRRRSFTWLGGAETGRGLMIGLCRAEGLDDAAIFGAGRFAPQELTEQERLQNVLASAPEQVQADCPDWLWKASADWVDDRVTAFRSLQTRAPIFVRVNLLKASRQSASKTLAADGIVTRPHPTVGTALEVTENARRLRISQAFKDGLVELQDAHSQAVIEYLGLAQGEVALDYCAGGGGKTLALAAATNALVYAHDANPRRMSDLPARAARAGAKVQIVQEQALAANTYDIILCDVPCSGSGAWRRDPEGKWRLTKETLSDLNSAQSSILAKASKLARRGTVLAYVTCSVLRCENDEIVDGFLSRNETWRLDSSHQFQPDANGDGFFIARLTHV